MNGDETTEAFRVVGAGRGGRFLVTCDHASNRVPGWVAGGDLGLPAADMARHIAWDVGAEGLALALAEALAGPCLLSNWSRLVIDLNRGEDDPTLVMQLYDGTIIPANRHIGAAEVERRLERLYRPYHAALARLALRRPDTVIVAVHSFTPCLRGRAPRPWHVGVLFAPADPRLSLPLVRELAADPALCVGVNEPYVGALPGDSIDRHALGGGRHNTLIEVRNDLISDPAGQRAWAARLASALQRALREAEHG